MDSNGLIGSWTTVDATVDAGGFATQGADGSVSTGHGGSAMNYEFNADGTYLHLLRPAGLSSH
jgi:hypothetical protein